MDKKLFCLRCGHKWNQRGKKKPKKCPSCTNPNWNKKKANEMLKIILPK